MLRWAIDPQKIGASAPFVRKKKTRVGALQHFKFVQNGSNGLQWTKTICKQMFGEFEFFWDVITFIGATERKIPHLTIKHQTFPANWKKAIPMFLNFRMSQENAWFGTMTLCWNSFLVSKMFQMKLRRWCMGGVVVMKLKLNLWVGKGFDVWLTCPWLIIFIWALYWAFFERVYKSHWLTSPNLLQRNKEEK